MVLDERIVQDIKKLQQDLLAGGQLIPLARLQQYYDAFRERFGPEQLRSRDGNSLLEYMHGNGNPDSLVYWLEFKNDDEFPNAFGSISGGSAHKFGIFRNSQTGLWMSGAPQAQYSVTEEEAIERARVHRDQLLSGIRLLEDLPSTGSDEDYRALQEALDNEAPDVVNTAWGHKYFSLMFPEKVDMFHVEYYQHFHLVKLLQMPPESDGRYLAAGRFVSAARQLEVPLHHLAVLLKERSGRPHRYWRIGTNLGKEAYDTWTDSRDGGFVTIGWDRLSDLSVYSDGQELEVAVKGLLTEFYPTEPRVITRWARLVKRFVNLGNYEGYLSQNDYVLAADGQTIRGIGRVVGEYQYVPGTRCVHRRPVEWLSAQEWALPKEEDCARIFDMKRYPINLVEAERRVLYAEPLPTVEPKKPEAAPGRAIRLSGIPGRIQSILDRKGQVILYGPPGTGKTFWAESAARSLASIGVFGMAYHDLSQEQQGRITSHYVRMCSFHPGYGYEDFLEGYRPEVVNDQMTFVRRDGIFKRLCDGAQAEPDHNFYLIIDEINRGDIPRIFGELLTVLERDKRGKAILLPVSERPFAVPKNIFIIGTMNTADRSIALLDTALRRRFGFLELMPDYDVLTDAAIEGIPLSLWLEALNKRIVEHVGRDARNLQIGHAYLLQDGKPVSSFPRFARMVQEDIIPLLEEYCYEDYDALEKILGRGLVDGRNQTIQHHLFDPARQDELIQALLAPSPEITTSLQAAVSDQPIEEEDDGDLNDEDGNR